MMNFVRGLGLTLGLAFSISIAFAQSPAQKMKDCLLIDDMTKDRLNCFDAIIAPAPKATKTKPKTVADCRFLKEEDERLICFNKFAETKQKKPAKKKMPPPPQ